MSGEERSQDAGEERSGSRRQRRRAGAPAKNFAQQGGKKTSHAAGTARSAQPHDESPDDARGFDAAFWADQRPPHWE